MGDIMRHSRRSAFSAFEKDLATVSLRTTLASLNSFRAMTT